ncbi:MAG: hypothetical protein Q9222_007064 [Ikaeria aurantiellina]
MSILKISLCIFILSTFWCVNHASSHILSAVSSESTNLSTPDLNPRAPHPLTLTTLATNIENLIRNLDSRREPFFNQATLQAVYLAVNQAQQPSPHIAEFRSIYCTFAAAGHIHERGHTGFAIENQFPLHWDRWQNPIPNQASPDFGELQWLEIQATMSVERADELLKGEGHGGAYYEVVVVEFGDRPVGYCFIMRHAPAPDWLVVVETGEVRALRRLLKGTLDQKDPQGHHPDGLASRKSFLAEHLQFQLQAEKGALDVQLLSVAIKKLPRLSTFKFDNTEVLSPASLNPILGGLDVSEPGPAWCRHVVQVGLQALVQAGSKPQIITIKNRHDKRYTPGWVLHDLTVIIPELQMGALLQNLRVFRFKRFRGASKKYGQADHPEALGSFLEKATQLEELHLDVMETFIEIPLRALVGRKQFKRLRILTLVNVQCDHAELASWLSLHSGSLREIHFQYCRLVDGRWDKLLDLLRSKTWPALSNIKLDRVRASNHGEAQQDWHWRYGSIPLVDYLQRRSETNPYIIYHPGWFPELFD